MQILHCHCWFAGDFDPAAGSEHITGRNTAIFSCGSAVLALDAAFVSALPATKLQTDMMDKWREQNQKRPVACRL
jgi:hypothetical protein